MRTLFAVTVDTEEQWNWNEGWPTGRPVVSNGAGYSNFRSFASITARR
jgi:hypothetical protein